MQERLEALRERARRANILHDELVKLQAANTFGKFMDLSDRPLQTAVWTAGLRVVLAEKEAELERLVGGNPVAPSRERGEDYRINLSAHCQPDEKLEPGRAEHHINTIAEDIDEGNVIGNG
jgi:hypothetical protein